MTASIESEMRSNGSDQSSSDLFLSSVSTRKLPLDCLFASIDRGGSDERERPTAKSVDRSCATCFWLIETDRRKTEKTSGRYY